MKRLTAIAVAAIASFITASGAFAQERGAQATIPFNFTVGEKALPAGTYILRSPASGIVVVQSRDHGAAAVSLAAHDSSMVKGEGKLVFDRYGDHYFLKEVLCADASLAVILPTSKQEKRVRTQEAMLPNTSEILLAMK